MCTLVKLYKLIITILIFAFISSNLIYVMHFKRITYVVIWLSADMYLTTGIHMLQIIN